MGGWSPFVFIINFKIMANRRMFSNRIANSAKFLQMPSEAQLLYFHMVLRADDDGVVEAYPLMKLLGSAPDVFRVLIGKGFVQQLNEDQVIVIMDWLEHNSIRADRKVDSIYKNLLINKFPELPLIEPKPRTDVEDNSKRIGGQSTVSISQVKLSQVKSIGYLSQIPPEDLKEFTERFDASEKGIKSKAEDLRLYCESKGRVYKNYKSFLLNALKKDLPERKKIVEVKKENIDLTKEQVEMNRQILKNSKPNFLK